MSNPNPFNPYEIIDFILRNEWLEPEHIVDYLKHKVYYHEGYLDRLNALLEKVGLKLIMIEQNPSRR